MVGTVQSSLNVKVHSYIAQYPVRRTAQSALHFTPWQTYSFQGHLNFSGKHSLYFIPDRPVHSNDNLTYLATYNHAAITAFTYPPPSTARYSFIQLGELRQRGVNEISQALRAQSPNIINYHVSNMVGFNCILYNL